MKQPITNISVNQAGRRWRVIFFRYGSTRVYFTKSAPSAGRAMRARAALYEQDARP